MSEKNPPLQARDKLTFLLSLVPFLMDHDRISVHEVARHFEVSDEHIRSAVRLIAISGIPGETNAYQPDDLFDIAWDDFEDNDQIVLTHLVAIDDSPRFSAREAAALIAGLQYLSALPEHANRGAIASLMLKLAHGASGMPSQVALEAPQTDATLPQIREAIATQRQIEIDYLNARGERERRTVDPLRLESVDADWYLRGWCHLRKALRTFRLDRIDNLTITGKEISHHQQDVVLTDALFESTADDIEVTLSIEPAALPLLADYVAQGAQPVELDGRLHMKILVSHLHGVKRLVNGMPGVVTVVSPASARAAVAAWAQAGSAKYSNLV